MAAYMRGTPLERFMRKVERSPDGCWLWTGYLNDRGYGNLRVGDKFVKAYRWSYEHFIGPVPFGNEVDHACRVRSCVNPDHLRAVTRKQNIENRDKLQRNNTSGYHGVHEYSPGRWEAYVTHNRKRLRLGTFDTPEAAAEAARLKRLELFTHNAVDGVVP